MSRTVAEAIWWAGVRAVDPAALVERHLAGEPQLRTAGRLLVVGGGKAAAGMAAGVERALADALPRVEGLVNVPAGVQVPLQRIRLHVARPAGVNEPRAEGVVGVEQMLQLLRQAGPQDWAICLLSGGASALMPAPVPGISLADKIALTRLLHGCGATIAEINCVRKHLSQIKGGRLAEAFRGQRLLTLILSDVVGDPVDVIASGPTVPDPTTYADACAVLQRYGLWSQTPLAIRRHLEAGCRGEIPETPKRLPAQVDYRIIGNNRLALDAAAAQARQFGYSVLDCGAFLEGETQALARVCAGLIRSIQHDGQPLAPPACILLGGETTVSLSPNSGRGGRNQEFVLALCAYLGLEHLPGVTLLSGGTDGEDGPTDAAGAWADLSLWQQAAQRGLQWPDYLARHDSHTFWQQVGGLFQTGLTGTNVMDLRIILVDPLPHPTIAAALSRRPTSGHNTHQDN
jgi:hydroxypyruvate reductase/glycerate 2-kinase